METATSGSEFVAGKTATEQIGPVVHLEVSGCPHKVKILYVW